MKYVWGVVVYETRALIDDCVKGRVRYHEPVKFQIMGHNLVRKIDDLKLKKAKEVYLMESKKQAEETAKYWDKIEKENGTYALDYDVWFVN